MPARISQEQSACGNGNKATYSAALNNPSTALGTTVGSTINLSAFWHPGTVEKRFEVQRLVISQSGGSGGVVQYRLFGASNLSGSLLEILKHDGGDPAPLAQPFGPAFVPAGTQLGLTFTAGGGDSREIELWRPTLFTGKPLTCRSNVAEGFYIVGEVLVALTTALRVSCSWTWTEE